MKDKETLRNKIGCLPAEEGGLATDDNLAIALACYFERRPECPMDDINNETGWSQWAMEKTNDLIDRIVEALATEPQANGC